jgi:putative transposase
LVAAPSERSVRHAWLTDTIRRVHVDSRGTYGNRRVHAELTLGHRLAVGYEQVTLLMRRAGIQGLSGRPRWRRAPNLPTAVDLVDRQFAYGRRDLSWVTEITEHPTSWVLVNVATLDRLGPLATRRRGRRVSIKFRQTDGAGV